MATGRPIVASDLPAIREILNENNSVLVPAGEPDKLADGIRKILENKELAEKLSDQALREVQEYSWEKRADKILRFII